MNNKLNLKQEYVECLHGIFEVHFPYVEVWAYGSRVGGDSHDGSDLDPAVIGLVKTTNDFVHDINKYFPERVEVAINSLDKPLK